MKFLREFIFVFIYLNFLRPRKEVSFIDLNFRKIDFTNYKQIKTFIFSKNFINLQNKNIQNFDFLNFSKNLGGKIGIGLSRSNIFNWYSANKNKIGYPWSDDLTSKRLINMVYNYEFINSSSTLIEKKLLDKIIIVHMCRCLDQFYYKKIGDISSYDLIAVLLSGFILKKNNNKIFNYLDLIIMKQIDSFGMHKSYNILEHSKFINNLKEIKNIFLFFNLRVSKNIEEIIVKMSSILNEYFHFDGSFPLFNGTNNNYTKIIYDSLNKDEYLISRKFSNSNNGIAFYSDKYKKIFFEVVQPNRDKISSNLSAGTLSFELSAFNEKIISNCGASESFGKNPEYLRYTAAHSTTVLQNTNISEIKENNPHLKFPQSVTFNSNEDENYMVFEGSHNGYAKKYNKIIKRKLEISKNETKVYGEDSIISLKNSKDRTFYHIRFHLFHGITFSFTNNKKTIILKTKNNNMWLFKSDSELVVEDSILVDKNTTLPTKQIVIKGIVVENKNVKKWSLEKI